MLGLHEVGRQRRGRRRTLLNTIVEEGVLITLSWSCSEAGEQKPSQERRDMGDATLQLSQVQRPFLPQEMQKCCVKIAVSLT
jgi:hypothetical protein